MAAEPGRRAGGVEGAPPRPARSARRPPTARTVVDDLAAGGPARGGRAGAGRRHRAPAVGGAAWNPAGSVGRRSRPTALVVFVGGDLGAHALGWPTGGDGGARSCRAPARPRCRRLAVGAGARCWSPTGWAGRPAGYGTGRRQWAGGHRRDRRAGRAGGGAGGELRLPARRRPVGARRPQPGDRDAPPGAQPGQRAGRRPRRLAGGADPGGHGQHGRGHGRRGDAAPAILAALCRHMAANCSQNGQPGSWRPSIRSRLIS